MGENGRLNRRRVNFISVILDSKATFIFKILSSVDMSPHYLITQLVAIKIQ